MGASDKIFIYRQTLDGPEACEEAARKVVGSSGFAILYSPAKCQLSTLGASGSDYKGIYETRFFGLDGEVRWSKNNMAVLTTEKNDVGDGWEKVAENEVIESMDRDYLAWGTYNNARNARKALFDHRVAPIILPKLPIMDNLKKGDRLVIRAREYLGVGPDEKFGNISVLAERLVGLEKYAEETKS